MQQLVELLGANAADPFDQSSITRLYKALEHATDMLETVRGDDRKKRKRESDSDDDDDGGEEDDGSVPLLLSEQSRQRFEVAVAVFASGVRQIDQTLAAFRDARHEMMQRQEDRRVERLRRNGRHCSHCPGKRGATCRCPRDCKRSEKFSHCAPKAPSAA